MARELYQKHNCKMLMRNRLNRQIEMGLIPEGTTLDESMMKAKPPACGYLAEERMAIHLAMVESIDRSVASIMAALKRTGKLDNTLILVLSNNGGSNQMVFDRGRKFPEDMRPGSVETFLNHGDALAALSNTPFRNYDTTNYEGGMPTRFSALRCRKRWNNSDS